MSSSKPDGLQAKQITARQRPASFFMPVKYQPCFFKQCFSSHQVFFQVRILPHAIANNKQLIKDKVIDAVSHFDEHARCPLMLKLPAGSTHPRLFLPLPAAITLWPAVPCVLFCLDFSPCP